MCLQWRRLEVWEDLLYSSQLFLSEGSGEFVFVRDVGSYVLLGTEFSCLAVGDKLGVELGSENALGRAKIVGVGVIGHGRGVSSGGRSCEGDDRILALQSRPYMSFRGGL